MCEATPNGDRYKSSFLSEPPDGTSVGSTDSSRQCSAQNSEELQCVARRLSEAQAQIGRLQAQVARLERNRPRQFPPVKFLDDSARKRILVTGGAGFVGSHLVDRLMLEGHEVIALDTLSTGRRRNVEQWLGHENFQLLEHDVADSFFTHVHQIYHLASPASPQHYMANPVRTIKTNTIGTLNMLGLARRVGARMLLASTSEVYGDPDVHPQTESYWGRVNPIGPRACYDEAKRVAETLAYAYMRQNNVSVRVARIFNTYGPRMHNLDGRVVSNFILQALQDKSITVYGSGEQTRSFQYVSDLVEGLVSLMASNYTAPVNLGNPVEHSIKEFASIIRETVGGTSDIVYRDAVIDDPQKRKPDITLAKQVLNWSPKVPLSEGIAKTVRYFRAELERSEHKHRNLYDPLADWSHIIADSDI